MRVHMVGEELVRCRRQLCLPDKGHGIGRQGPRGRACRGRWGGEAE
jgi:hypothetical protein